MHLHIVCKRLLEYRYIRTYIFIMCICMYVHMYVCTMMYLLCVCIDVHTYLHIYVLTGTYVSCFRIQQKKQATFSKAAEHESLYSQLQSNTAKDMAKVRAHPFVVLWLLDLICPWVAFSRDGYPAGCSAMSCCPCLLVFLRVQYRICRLKQSVEKRKSPL